jgi:hypothetical protein
VITLFNAWHYGIVVVAFIILLGGILLAFRENNPKIKRQIIFLFFILFAVIAGFGIFAVDKYTKVAKLYKLENKRNLSTEEIMYSGIVKNEGKYEIGEVIFEIKLVNKGHVSGNVKSGSYFKPSNFFDFFSGGSFSDRSKPQQVIHEFVVAKNLKPGESQRFRVYFEYPPYFSSVSHFSKLYVH